MFTTLLVGYSSFHAGHALLHMLRIHVHHHHEDHHIADHGHFFRTWFATEHDHHQENKHATLEIFPVFIFAEALYEMQFFNPSQWLLKSSFFLQSLFKEIKLTPPTPPPVV